MRACLTRLAQHARSSRGSAPALRECDAAGAVRSELTWAELATTVERLAAGLLARGDLRAGPVQLSLPNGIAAVLALLASLRAGLTVFPVSPRLGPAELARAAAAAGACARFGDPELAQAHDLLALGTDPGAHAADAPVPPPTAARLLLQSSGTTGVSKLVLRCDQALDAVAGNVAAAVGLGAEDRVLAVIPLAHSYGIENAILAPLWAGSTVTILPDFDPDLVRALWRRDGITCTPLVPFMVEMLAERLAAGDAAALRACYSAGARLPASLRARCRERGLAVGELYGATEIGSVTYLPPACAPAAEGAVGWPMAGVAARVVERDDPNRDCPPGGEGELHIRAPSAFAGYGAAGEEPAGPWFATGDLAWIAADGQIVITGRRKLLIDVAGQKVNPQEVEAELCAHPAVAAAVIRPWPVSPTLNRLRAFVELAPGAVAPAAGELRAFLAERLAPYKLPRRVVVVERLPRSPLGKILREAVDA